jgi:Ran GTPase-activating protein (RanGAP) involved in mRNA processing and transport
MTIDEILNALQKNVIRRLCGRALFEVGINRRTPIDDADMRLFAKALCANTSLTALDLPRSRLSFRGAELLADALRVRTQLRSLNFSYSELGETAIDQALTLYTSLTSINFLNFHDVWVPCQEHLVNVVRANTSLRGLELRPCNTLQCQRLAETLQHLPHLSLLNIRESELNDAAASAIVAYVKESKTLCSLNVALCFHKVGAQKNALLDALKCNNSLTSVNLRASTARCFDGKRLADVLRENTTLTSLKFEGNHLFPAEIVSVAAALKYNTSLKSIYLDATQLDLRGVQELAEALTVNTTLTFIGLSRNRIRPLAARAIAAALYVNASLVSVNLSANQIGDLGAQAFADMLLINTSLRTLNLGSNDLGEVGIPAIMAALKKNTSLRSLTVNDTAPVMQLLQASTDMLRVNTSLMSISMPQCTRSNFRYFNPALMKEAHEMIVTALQNNSSLIAFISDYGIPHSKEVHAARFGVQIPKLLKRNQRQFFFIRSPHGLKNIILYSLFSKPLRPDLSQGHYLPHMVKFQLTQYAIALSLLDNNILGRAIMAGWCCDCGTETQDVCALDNPEYACVLNPMS